MIIVYIFFANIDIMNGIPNILFHIFISGDNIIHKLTKQQS